MKIITPRFVLAGILGLGLALSAATPASADKPKGRLKDEKRALKQAQKQVRRADNRGERQAARANVFNAKQNLQRERFQIKRDDRGSRISQSRLRRNRFEAIRRSQPIPRDVYHSRFNR